MNQTPRFFKEEQMLTKKDKDAHIFLPLMQADLSQCPSACSLENLKLHQVSLSSDIVVKQGVLSRTMRRKQSRRKHTRKGDKMRICGGPQTLQGTIGYFQPSLCLAS